tara:strand:- start:45 stop:272 length:228 start_codon:yes stop_codon:yes gene_type:complete
MKKLITNKNQNPYGEDYIKGESVQMIYVTDAGRGMNQYGTKMVTVTKCNKITVNVIEEDGTKWQLDKKYEIKKLK